MLRFIGFCAVVFLCAKFVMPIIDAKIDAVKLPQSIGSNKASKALRGEFDK